MQELTIKLPNKLWHRLKSQALIEKTGIEDVILKRLNDLAGEEDLDLPGKYQKFFKESGLFVQVNEQEKHQYEPMSESERDALAEQFSIGKPLSQLIIEERG